MTSNTGSRQLKDFGTGVGFNTKSREQNKSDDSSNIIETELKKKFAPEFLNRIDDVVIFNSLSKEDIGKIVDIELLKLEKRLESMDLFLEVKEEARNFIADNGFDPQYGARPLKRAIQKYVEDVLTEEIIKQNPEKGAKLILNYDNSLNKMKVDILKKKKYRKKEENIDIQ